MTDALLDRPAEAVSPRRGPQGSELIAIALLLTAIVLAQALLTRSTIVFHHSFWLDEFLTWQLVNDPSLAHSLRALHGGVDTNPPTMYLILWPIAKLIGGLNEWGLHVLSFVSVIIALLGVFTLCRRHFDVLASLIGAMVVAAHPVVIYQTFDARFYGLWLAATAWYAVSLARLRGAQTAGRLIASSVLAVLAATAHYFGIVGVLLISGADLLIDRSPPRSRLWRAIPPLIGLAATCACIPFALSQGEGLHARTWTNPATFSEMRTMLTGLLGAPPVLLIVLCAWALRLIRSQPSNSQCLDDFVPITALLLFPFFVIAFSILVQPAMLDRYMIVAIAPLGVLGAYLAAGQPRWFAGTMLLGMFLIGAAELRSSAGAFRGTGQEQRAVIDAIHSLNDSPPIVFKRRVEMYPLMRVAPELLPRSSLLDAEILHEDQVRPFTIFERDMARKFERYYPSFKSVRLMDLSRESPVFVIVPPDANERNELRLLFPDRRVESRGPWLVEIMPREPKP